MNRYLFLLVLTILNASQVWGADTDKAFVLRDKTLVAWVTVANLDSRGGSVLTIGGGDSFDGIIFGEQQPRKWMPGSEYWRRTDRTQDDWAEETAGPDELIQVAVTYAGQTVTLFR